jgi:hypothetical protein
LALIGCLLGLQQFFGFYFFLRIGRVVPFEAVVQLVNVRKLKELRPHFDIAVRTTGLLENPLVNVLLPNHKKFAFLPEAFFFLVQNRDQ